jgi:hypothetical protein
VVGPTEPVPRGPTLADLVRTHCGARPAGSSDPARPAGP